MKKILSLLLVCLMLPVTAFASGNFKQINAAQTVNFSDVSQSDWFYESVKGAFGYGLTDGTGDGKYTPYGLVSIAEVITFADRINFLYNDAEPVVSGEEGKWYEPWVDYAVQNNIIEKGEFEGKYEKPATRGQVAYVLGNALPFSEYENINTSLGTVPDMQNTDEYYNEVIMLYRAGILTGKDQNGSFAPTENIIRAEMAAVVYRIVDNSARIKIDFPKQSETGTSSSGKVYDAEGISEIASNAVFLIAVYDAKGDMTGSGSGFFIDKNGTAVTNYHVIEGASSAEIMTVDGNSYKVDKVLAADKERDVAILKIGGENFPTVSVGDSDKIRNGQKIFCIGSPLGLDNTISEGLISNSSRIIEDNEYIQISAPISPGSSGGAVFTESGEVIGITSASATAGQNINLVIPINCIFDLNWDKDESLSEMFGGNVKRAEVITYYSVDKTVPEYTAVTGASLAGTQTGEDGYAFEYKFDADQFNAYLAYLMEEGFQIAKRQIDSTSQKYVYYLVKNNTIVAAEAVLTSQKVYIVIYKESTSNGESSGKKSESTVSSDNYYEGTEIPTYTYVSGRRCIQIKESDGYKVYFYSGNQIEIMSYVSYLARFGWKVASLSHSGEFMNYIMTDGKKEIILQYSMMYGELRIWI